MKIGIDITTVLVENYKVGIPWYAYRLIKNIEKIDKTNFYTLYACSLTKYKKKFDLKKEFKSENFHIQVKFFHRRIFNYAVLTFLPIEFFFGRFDIIHTLHHFSPINLYGKQVVTIHDLTPLINPDWFHRLYDKEFRFIISKAIKRTDVIITVSHSTKRDLVNFFNVNPEKIKVIYLAPDETYKLIEDDEAITQVKKKYKITKKYLLFVGTIEPRKNLIRLLNVFKKIKNKLSDYQLVITGKIGWKTKIFFETIENIPEWIKNDIIITGYVSQDDLPLLYNGCDIFIYPSLYEGFGLPIVEAMRCGVPVITSNISSMPEVAGDGAILVNPEDEEEIGNAIIRLIEDRELREELKKKGLERSKMFSWEKTAIETLKVYKELE